MSQELLNAIAHIKRILAKWKTQPGQSEAATIPGVGPVVGQLAPVGTPVPGRRPERDNPGTLGDYLRDLTYALDMLADAVAKLSQPQPLAPDTTGPQGTDVLYALRQLQARIDRWKGEDRPRMESLEQAMTRTEREAEKLSNAIVRLEVRTDCPPTGEVTALLALTRQQVQGLVLGVVLACGLAGTATLASLVACGVALGLGGA